MRCYYDPAVPDQPGQSGAQEEPPAPLPKPKERPAVLQGEERPQVEEGDDIQATPDAVNVKAKDTNSGGTEPDQTWIRAGGNKPTA